jgi:ESF2/ABP1 family protein
MTTRKHNDFLDVAASDDEVDRGYDSDEKVASKGRAVKRRKRAADTQDFFGLQSDEDSESEDSEVEESHLKGKAHKQTKAKTSSASDDEKRDDDSDDAEEGGVDLDDDEEGAYPETGTTKSKSKAVKPLSDLKKIGKQKKKQKLGVVYREFRR